jgi:hypothetical protein
VEGTLAARVVSRFGELSPELSAVFGASVDVGLSFGARNAAARAFSASARAPRAADRGAALPAAIATVRDLPPSRVGAAFAPDGGEK